MFRNRNTTNENAHRNVVTAVKGGEKVDENAGRVPLKGEKRQIKGVVGSENEPQAKRIALNEISQNLSNVVIDSTRKTVAKRTTLKGGKKQAVATGPASRPGSTLPVVVDPCPDYDFDKECGKDIVHVAEYATDIFCYYRSRQPLFAVTKYLGRQRHITQEMRGRVVNWMVGIQEQFELNHETLYLAVKVFDMYLSRTKSVVQQNDLQLVGSTAIFLAAKYDERLAPLIDDILYMCNDVYSKRQLIKMELIMYKTIGCDLGAPVSYRFLRRFARVIHLNMPALTLARYILETQLLFYCYIDVPEDLMASATLLLALRMKNMGDWDARLEKYTGYTLAEVEPLMWSLNHMIVKRATTYPELNAAYHKYSHEIFFEVTQVPSLPDSFPLDAPITPPGF